MYRERFGISECEPSAFHKSITGETRHVAAITTPLKGSRCFIEPSTNTLSNSMPSFDQMKDEELGYGLVILFQQRAKTAPYVSKAQRLPRDRENIARLSGSLVSSQLRKSVTRQYSILTYRSKNARPRLSVSCLQEFCVRTV